MDQVKTIARQAREHWFWIASASIFLVGLVAWFCVTMGISQETATWTSDIESRFSTATQVLNTGYTPEGRTEKFHPNDITHRKMDQQIATLKQSVLKAWEEQHSSQGERAFAWPTALNEAFRKRVTEITSRTDANGNLVRLPIEQAVPFPLPKSSDALLDITMRQIYGDYIRTELPKLAAKIKSNWGVPDPEKPKPVVYWDPTNQQHIANSRFEWSTQESGAPNTLQVLYAQEDLRVLEALMDIIAQTNRNATADFNAVIKRIEFIHLGRDASRRAGVIKRLGSALNAAANGENPEGPTGPYGDADFAGDGGEGFGDDIGGDDIGGDVGEEFADDIMDDESLDGDMLEDDLGMEDEFTDGGDPEAESSGEESADPAHHRYVDLNYQPLSAKMLRDSFSSKDPKIAKLAVAKRLPVRMRVVIDQRRLNELLAACGNSWLTVEVRQVRLNPQADAAPVPTTSSSAATSGGGFGGGSFNFGIPAQEDSEFSEGGSFNSSVQREETTKDKNTQFDVKVELYGVVYIYNPVDTKKFGVPSEATPEDEAAVPLAEASP